jgi:hypothetical protein
MAEIGQMAFHPQSIEEFETQEALDEPLFAFLEACGFSSYGQPQFANTSRADDASDPHATLITNVFRVRPFDWSDSPDPQAAVNLEYAGGAVLEDGALAKPFKLSWYKYAGRSMSADREINDNEIAAIFSHCLKSLGNEHETGFHVHEHLGTVIHASAPSKTRNGQTIHTVKISHDRTKTIVDYVVFSELPPWFKLDATIAFDSAAPKPRSPYKPRIVLFSLSNGKNSRAF